MKTVYLIQQDVDDGTPYSDFKHTNDIGIAMTKEIAEGVKKKYDDMRPELDDVTGCRHFPCDIFDIKLFEASDI